MTNTAGQELTNNHTHRGQKTNQIRTQEVGTQDTHDRGLTATGTLLNVSYCSSQKQQGHKGSDLFVCELLL